jgi:serine/threonine protein kinase
VLQENQTLDDFKIIRLLGKGGMGEVYEAEQADPHRHVALKVLAPWLAKNEEALARFWREVNVPAQLDHPGIVRIISTGKTEDGVVYYTMHLVRGISIAQLLRLSAEIPLNSTQAYSDSPAHTPSRDDAPPEQQPAEPFLEMGNLPPIVVDYLRNPFQTTARIGALAARVLASAHEKGFLHRDIKPSNLMVDFYGHLYLVDFGLTRSLQGGGAETRSGTVIGTPCYMSPEQARGEPLDPHSDIYSLGVTLYELATGGQGPFTADRRNGDAVLEQVRAGARLPLRTLAPNAPVPLQRVIERCLAHNPRHRYASAVELAADLECCQADAHGRRKRTFLGQRTGKALGLAALGALLLAGILTYFLTRPEKRESQNPPNDATPPDALLDDRGKPYPEVLRNRPWRLPIPLLRDDFEPLWCRRLDGTGKYHPVPKGKFLNLASMDSGAPTMLILDDDPARRSFRFSLELNQYDVKKPGQHQLGVFFGGPTRRADEEGTIRCFFIHLDEKPQDKLPHGRVLIGTRTFTKGNELRGNVRGPLVPVAKDKGTIPLSRSRVYHRLTVQAANHEVSVTVDETHTLRFDPSTVNQEDPGGQSLSPLGALGIWVKSGWGFFRDISITALPEGRH